MQLLKFKCFAGVKSRPFLPSLQRILEHHNDGTQPLSCCEMYAMPWRMLLTLRYYNHFGKSVSFIITSLSRCGLTEEPERNLVTAGGGGVSLCHVV